MNFRFVSFFILWISLNASYAQDAKPPSSLKKTISFYKDQVGNSSSLYSGREYLGYNYKIKGHQYFESTDWEKGDLQYNGIQYEDIRLLYDLVRDELIVNHPENEFSILLTKKNIESFTLHGHHFIKLIIDTKNESFSLNGFYDKVKEGKIEVLVKRSKAVVEKIDQRQATSSFVQNNKYYLRKEGVLIPVKSKKSVLKLFKEQRGLIRKKLKKNKVRYKQDPEYAIIKIVEYYEEAQ